MVGKATKPSRNEKTGVTSINVARSFVHCSSLMGLSEMMYLPSVCSSCQASRQSAGFLFLSQKMGRGHVGRDMLAVRHLGDVAVLVAEDLDRLVLVADGALVERALDAVVGLRLPGF